MEEAFGESKVIADRTINLCTILFNAIFKFFLFFWWFSMYFCSHQLAYLKRAILIFILYYVFVFLVPRCVVSTSTEKL